MKQYKTYLQQRGYTKSTQAGYAYQAEKFIAWYGFEPENAEKKDILNYLEYLRTVKKQQNITRQSGLIALARYFDYLIHRKHILKNPCSLIKIRGTRHKRLHTVFTPEELAQIADDYYTVYIQNYNLAAIPKNMRERTHLSRNRNLCMLTFLLYQGLHTNELQYILTDDINIMKAKVNIRGNRQTAERILPLKAEQTGILMNYIQTIRPKIAELFPPETPELFLTLSEGDKNLMHPAKKLILEVKNIRPGFTGFNQIRASVITHQIKTAGLRKAQYFAGHKYITSTETYLTNDLESLADEMSKFNPF